MGTRGYKAYRYKGWYHVYYNHLDSYPEGLGVAFASQVPVGDPKKYQRWLERMRESLDRSFEQNKDNLESGDMEYNITRQQPMNDIFIEWVYEIDLDHEVFLVDSNPLFALSNMPDSEELFLNSIGFDSYGHRACSPSTPAKHVYNWKSAPPMVEDSVIEHYTARQSSENYSKLSIEELLGVASSVSVTEAVRTQLYEVIIGQIMQEWSVGHDIRALEALPDRGHLTERLISIGVGMVSVALGHMIFGSILDAEVKKISATDFTWLTSDICLRITTHLDDERHVKKAVLELVDEVVLNRKQPRVTYGILFSFFHCVIVQVEPNSGFKSTVPLQFLPSFYATSPSTPGITVIARLAYHCLKAAAEIDGSTNTLPPNHSFSKVPADVWEHIAENLDPSDLIHLRSAAPFTILGTDALLRYPYVGSYRLLDVEAEEEEKPRLKSRSFSTMLQGSFVQNLVVGAHNHRIPTHFVVSLGAKKRKIQYAVKRLEATDTQI